MLIVRLPSVPCPRTVRTVGPPQMRARSDDRVLLFISHISGDACESLAETSGSALSARRRPAAIDLHLNPCCRERPFARSALEWAGRPGANV